MANEADKFSSTGVRSFEPQKVRPLIVANDATTDSTLITSRQAYQREPNEQTTIPTSTNAALIEMLIQNVNLNSVRKMIAQYFLELLVICVIITYLIYYFSHISRRPKLIGHNRSNFVKFIKTHLNGTLDRRFNPLIYFWGTNPQTALFGYLQGQSSVDEMPRNKFYRQYLYVSDAQYLTSNVDLSKHYTDRKQRLLQLKAPQLLEDCSSSSLSSASSSSSSNNNNNSNNIGLQLDENIRLALNGLLRSNEVNNNEASNASGKSSSSIATTTTPTPSSSSSPTSSSSSIKLARKIKPPLISKDLSTSSGSSTDSGVFVNQSFGSSSSSTSSLATATPVDCDEDEELKQQLPAGSDKMPSRCSCKARYDASESHLEPLATCMKFNQQQQATSQEKLEFGQCALDWFKESHKNYHKNKLVALISAGMTTGSDKKYVTDTVSTLDKLGYEVCVFIRRGVGGLKLSSAKFFSPAKWRDFEAAVLSIRQQRPNAHLVAIGFSFGSIELCRYLSMSGKRSLVDAALLISCPFDPEAGGRNMRKRALNRRIDAYLAKNLGKQLYLAMWESQAHKNQQKQNLELGANNLGNFKNHNGSLVNLTSLPKIKSLVDFEDNFNRVLQNYPNSEAYADDSRLQDHLASIETPTLCLSSEDDFMAPLRLLPLEQIRANKRLCMVLTKRGGHMGFIDGLLWPKRPYFAQRIIGNYMSAVGKALQSESDINQSSTSQLAEGPHHSIRMFKCDEK